MKVLFWDIETLPLDITSWTLFDLKVSHENILRDFSLICAAWKWFGEKEVHCVAVDPANPTDDGNVVRTLHAVLSEADVVVAHNGDKFDMKKFKTRALAHGLPPLPSIQSIDTLKVAKKNFGFTSNRLDYLGKFLGVGRKIKTEYDLWLDILEGDEKALAKMVRYNKYDVVLLEKVYKALRPYMTNHPNTGLFTEDPKVCPICGAGLVKRGFRYHRTTKRQQYQCKRCGGYCSGKTVRHVEVS
jgi:uncharacterized protein YprB with RNaseH-like and TPR domain